MNENKLKQECLNNITSYGYGNHGPKEHLNPLEAYMMSQSICYPPAQRDRWQKFLVQAAKTREYMYLMSDNELSTYHSLPDKVVVFRGVRTRELIDDYGFSWSLSYGVAKWFSKNRGDPEGTSRVLKKTVPKHDIVWLLLERDEFEVVLSR